MRHGFFVLAKLVVALATEVIVHGETVFLIIEGLRIISNQVLILLVVRFSMNSS